MRRKDTESNCVEVQVWKTAGLPICELLEVYSPLWPGPPGYREQCLLERADLKCNVNTVCYIIGIISVLQLSLRVPYYRRTWHIKSDLKGNSFKISNCLGVRKDFYFTRGMPSKFFKKIASCISKYSIHTIVMDALGSLTCYIKVKLKHFQCFNK